MKMLGDLSAIYIFFIILNKMKNDNYRTSKSKRNYVELKVYRVISNGLGALDLTGRVTMDILFEFRLGEQPSSNIENMGGGGKNFRNAKISCSWVTKKFGRLRYHKNFCIPRVLLLIRFLRFKVGLIRLKTTKEREIAHIQIYSIPVIIFSTSEPPPKWFLLHFYKRISKKLQKIKIERSLIDLRCIPPKVCFPNLQTWGRGLGLHGQYWRLIPPNVLQKVCPYKALGTPPNFDIRMANKTIFWSYNRNMYPKIEINSPSSLLLCTNFNIFFGQIFIVER